MSLSLSLQSALSGLQANQSVLQVISNNIANVNTDGYSRKVAEPQSVSLDGVGAGVRLGNVTRNVDRNLVSEAHLALSSLAALDDGSKLVSIANRSHWYGFSIRYVVLK